MEIWKVADAKSTEFWRCHQLFSTDSSFIFKFSTSLLSDAKSILKLILRLLENLFLPFSVFWLDTDQVHQLESLYNHSLSLEMVSFSSLFIPALNLNETKSWAPLVSPLPSETMALVVTVEGDWGISLSIVITSCFPFISKSCSSSSSDDDAFVSSNPKF